MATVQIGPYRSYFTNAAGKASSIWDNTSPAVKDAVKVIAIGVAVDILTGAFTVGAATGAAVIVVVKKNGNAKHPQR